MFPIPLQSPLATASSFLRCTSMLHHTTYMLSWDDLQRHRTLQHRCFKLTSPKIKRAFLLPLPVRDLGRPKTPLQLSVCRCHLELGDTGSGTAPGVPEGLRPMWTPKVDTEQDHSFPRCCLG